jgi:purine-binding chemotaxis protein CheW
MSEVDVPGPGAPGMALGDLREQHADNETEFLEFMCEGEAYAVPLRGVREIVVPPPLTPVPRSRPAVLGVASVRGQLVTVVNFRAVMGLPRASLARRGRLLLGRGPDNELMALMVDEVYQVLRLHKSQIETGSVLHTGEFSDLLRGIGRPEGGEVVALLDIYALFAKGTR